MQQTEAEVSQIKKRLHYFVIAFIIIEVFILSLKTVIFAANKNWNNMMGLQITYLVLYAIRVSFPVTL